MIYQASIGFYSPIGFIWLQRGAGCRIMQGKWLWSKD